MGGATEAEMNERRDRRKTGREWEKMCEREIDLLSTLAHRYAKGEKTKEPYEYKSMRRTTILLCVPFFLSIYLS